MANDGDKIVGNNTIADDMILLLGEIKGQGEENSKKLDKVDIKVDTIGAQTIRNESAAAAAHRRLDEIKPKVDNHERYFNQVQGAGHAIHLGWIIACAVLTGLATLAGMFLF